MYILPPFLIIDHPLRPNPQSLRLYIVVYLSTFDNIEPSLYAYAILFILYIFSLIKSYINLKINALNIVYNIKLLYICNVRKS